MKKIVLLVLTGGLIGCGAGNPLNPTPKQYSVESTSNSPYPGTLEKYESAAIFSTDALVNAANNAICLPNTPDSVCSDNKQNLQNDYGFNLSQISGGYNVSAYTIQYNTPGVYNENRSVSGGVLIPLVEESQIKGIILYFHGTEAAKNAVPSCFAQSQANTPYCLNNNGTNYGELLGGIFASQGYIVIMPDYIGQGFDSVVMHPYALFAQADAVSGLNMINATNTLLKNLGLNDINTNLYVTGFSEGGAYSLWAANILQNTNNNFLANTNFHLQSAIGLSGAYDLLNAQMPMEADNVTLSDQYNIGNTLFAGAAKPSLIGYLLTAYGFYDLDQQYSSLMQSAFLNCNTCLISGNVYAVPDLFTTYGNPDLTDTNIELYLTSAAAMTGYLVNGNNSARALVQSGLLEDESFLQVLQANSLVSWQSTAPVKFVYLNKDSVVTNLNSTNSYNGLQDNQKAAVIIDTSKYEFSDPANKNAVTPIDHTQSQIFQLIAALQQVESSE